MIYFIQEACDPRGPVKVGQTGDMRRRLGQIQGGNPRPLMLLGVLPGGEEREREIHALIEVSRIWIPRGTERFSTEWFCWSDTLERLIAQAKPVFHVDRRRVARPLR